MNLIYSFLATAALLLSQQTLSCNEPTTCDKCAKESEFTWNPNNQFVTRRLSRFYDMEELIEAQYQSKNYEKVQELIEEYLKLAKVYRCNWNYGNAIHYSHRIRGLILLESGDIDGAAEELIAAGQSTGSPQLDTFGPELDLANQLLQAGRTEEVITYLNGVEKFWEMDGGVVEKWIQEIRAGETPVLDRFNKEPGSLQIGIGALILAAPLLICAGFLFARRRTIQRKLLYIFSSVPLAYLVSFLGGWSGGLVSDFLSGNESFMAKFLLPWIIFLAVLTTFILPSLTAYVVAKKLEVAEIEDS